MQNTFSTLAAWIAITSAPALGAQSEADATSAAPGYAQVAGALEAWREAHGAGWRIVFDPETLNARFLFGASMDAEFAPRTSADFVALARSALVQSFELHRIRLATLVDDEVVFLPLSAAGSTDKQSVQFRQEFGGVPVIDGQVNVLFDLGGRLLSVDTTALPDFADCASSPSLEARAATRIATASFTRDTGLVPTSTSAPELAVAQVLAERTRTARLVWRVTVLEASAPAGFEYRIDARDGTVLQRLAAIHNDVSGTLRTMATPGLLPDMPANPETQQDLVHVTVTSAAGNANTDAAGNFTIVGASPPLAVSVQYSGPFCDAQNAAQPNYVLAQNLLAASGNLLLMNPASATPVTPEANVCVWINKLRDWVRAVNPSDGKADFQATANVNLNQTCNAYYDGASVNFFTAGGGCNNTAYSTVVIHEMGHWLNTRYLSGNGADGFGEGAADAWSMYLVDDPDVGEYFGTMGWGIRTGNNTRPFCGDSNPGCYGEVHADGEVLMGALWKVRVRLETALGNSAGALAADTLFNAWFNAYNDGHIKTIVEVHWLTLDDDDGYIDNGTPNFASIDGGFRAQGFPGYVPGPIGFVNVTRLADTEDLNGPYVVAADISANVNGPVTSPELHYRVDGGAWQTLAMQNSSGISFVAAIPGQACATDIDYYLSASDSGGATASYPNGAPNSMLDFLVGWRFPALKTDFESGVAGWTHGSFGDTANTEDEWQLSSQFSYITGTAGKSGDPRLASSGDSLWGVDLGQGSANGAYGPNVHAWLRSPAIDCRSTNDVRLRFRRWLTVEQSAHDSAQIAVNGNVVWQNPAGADLLDAAWIPVDLDISAFAANNPSVVVEFSLRSDGAVEYGGWNIDDFQVYTPGLCGHSCPAPTVYCDAKWTSQHTLPAIGSYGIPTLVTDNFNITLRDARSNQQALCFWSGAPASVWFKSGWRCVAVPLVRMALTQTNGAGAAQIAVPLDASMAGTQRFYQWWFRDPGDMYSLGLSDGLSVEFRP